MEDDLSLIHISPLAVLITAIGVSYLLQNIALLIFGADTKSFSSVVPLQNIKIGGITITGVTVVAVLACIVIMIGLMIFIKKTKAGQAMLAVSEDKDAAQLMGVNVNGTISLTFAIGSGLAAIAGVLLCSAYPTLTPYTGSMPGIKAFTAAVFGGIGSIPGAFIGGILLGIIEILGKAYISSQLSDAIVFAVLIIVLLAVSYTHLNPYMVVCFLACAKAGRSYVPQDICIPVSRVDETVLSVEPELTFVVEGDYQTEIGTEIGKDEIEEIVKQETNETDVLQPLTKDEVWYIIFTSGSTGKPKGVEITRDCLSHYLDWSVQLGSTMEEKGGAHFMNKAPFSFDLSVMDLYTSLVCGGTLYTMDKKMQSDYSEMLGFLEQSEIEIWVRCV